MVQLLHFKALETFTYFGFVFAAGFVEIAAQHSHLLIHLLLCCAFYPSSLSLVFSGWHPPNLPVFVLNILKGSSHLLEAVLLV